MRKVILGIDAGASSTVAMAFDLADGVVDVIQGPELDLLSCDPATINQRLGEAVKGLPGDAVRDCAVFSVGVPGGRFPQGKMLVATLARELGIRGEVLTFSDVEAVWQGATAGSAGVVAYSGTGSFAYGKRDPNEPLHLGMQEGSAAHCADGVGPFLGDGGSAYDIGRRILQHTAATLDGRDTPTALAKAALEQLGVGSLDQLVQRVYSGIYPNRRQVARLAPLASNCARRGEERASTILREAARKLVYSTIVVLKQLGHTSRDPLRVFYSGGVFSEEQWFRSSFIEHLQESFPSIEIAEGQFAPVIGSVLIGYRNLAGDVPDDVLAKLPRGKNMKIP